MWTRRRLRMSWWNALVTLAVLAGAVVLAVSGQWVPAVLLAGIGLATGSFAVYARSGRASDITRLNAMEVVDERDRAMTTFALAVVGVTGLLLSVVVFIAAMVLLEHGHPMFYFAWGQVMVLAVVWTVANVLAVRRL